METENVLVNHVCSLFLFLDGLSITNKSELWYQNSNANIHAGSGWALKSPRELLISEHMLPEIDLFSLCVGVCVCVCL